MKCEKGQALIELALTIFLLLMILFGITEFGRYFFHRHVYNNAVRLGVRLAVVTTPLSTVNEDCLGTVSIVVYTCSSIMGADESINIDVQLFDSDDIPHGGPAENGDRVRIRVTSSFTILTGSIIPFFSGTRPIIGEASMRYEL